ncbi:hypothetical protein Hanom_Chr07g00680931 [Helianthus anomalus]
MELSSWMKMTRFQTFRIQKPLDESGKTGQTSGTKMAFHSQSFKHQTTVTTRSLVFVLTWLGSTL